MTVQGDSDTFERRHISDPRSVTRILVGELLDELVTSEIDDHEAEQYTYRNRRHAIAWACTYVMTEFERLQEEFISDKKYFEFDIHVDQHREWIRFVFSLKTAGLDGSTSYYIQIKRDGKYFACDE